MKLEQKICDTIAAYAAADKTWEKVNSIDHWHSVAGSIYRCLNKNMPNEFISSVLEKLSNRFKDIASKKKYLIADLYLDVMQNEHHRCCHPCDSKIFETSKMKVFCIIVEEQLVVRIICDNCVYDLLEIEDDDEGLIFHYISAILTDDSEDLDKDRYGYEHYVDFTQYERSDDD